MSLESVQMNFLLLEFKKKLLSITINTGREAALTYNYFFSHPLSLDGEILKKVKFGKKQ